LLENEPTGIAWHKPEETQKLLASMSDINRRKVMQAQANGRAKVGTVYRRTRGGVVRAEVRFDGISGCLRTPSGGSSRQTILVVEGPRVRSRLLSAREAARLMGLPDDYKLPERYNDAYHLAGDGVAVPVVAHIASALLEPILAEQQCRTVARVAA
jgi:DNA (cytosine-5)-methyltransferase 1